MDYISIIGCSVALLLFLLIFIISSSIVKKNKENAYKLLIKGIEQETLGEQDIYLIYRQLLVNNKIDILYIDFLESFLLYVRQKDKDGVLTKKSTKITIPIIEKEKEKTTYSNIQERERRILLAIETSVNEGETTSLKNYLVDLSEAIASNLKDLNNARQTNKWTIPISIISILISLIMWYSESSLSDSDVKRISNQIYTSITDSLNISNSDSLINPKCPFSNTKSETAIDDHQ
ncbi:MAG: hypothetical protein J5542_04260 [Bacteroidales bacterium]|nr:hypothetical protein [Bacteroidales bacterium]